MESLQIEYMTNDIEGSKDKKSRLDRYNRKLELSLEKSGVDINIYKPLLDIVINARQ